MSILGINCSKMFYLLLGYTFSVSLYNECVKTFRLLSIRTDSSRFLSPLIGASFLHAHQNRTEPLGTPRALMWNYNERSRNLVCVGVWWKNRNLRECGGPYIWPICLVFILYNVYFQCLKFKNISLLYVPPPKKNY